MMKEIRPDRKGSESGVVNCKNCSNEVHHLSIDDKGRCPMCGQKMW